ncbi:endo-1,3-beta glucanase [Oleoguttula sp. CCFEE 5521]
MSSSICDGRSRLIVAETRSETNKSTSPHYLKLGALQNRIPTLFAPQPALPGEHQTLFKLHRIGRDYGAIEEKFFRLSMARLRASLQTLKVVPALVILLQAQQALAHPFVYRRDPNNGTGPRSHLAPQNAVPQSIEGLETTSWPSTTCTTVTGWHTTYTISQIRDGQIQAPGSGPTSLPDESVVTTSTSGASPTTESTSFEGVTVTSTATSEVTSTISSTVEADTAATIAVSGAQVSSSSSSSSSASSSASSTSTSTAPSTTIELLTQTSSTSSSSSSSTSTAVTSTAPASAQASPTPTSSATTTTSSPDVIDASTTVAVSTILSTTTIVVSTSVPDISLTSLTTSAVQTATVPVLTNTTGIIQTSLEAGGNPTTVPFPTSVVNVTSSLSLVDTSTLQSVVPTNTANITSITASDIFRAIATSAPPPQITSRSDHPVPQKGIQPQSERIGTNSFHANLFLADQAYPVYTFPYSVSWSNGTGQTGSYGLAVSHTERNQLAFGADEPNTGAWKFYANPIGIQSVVLSATQLGQGTKLTTDSLTSFSVNVNLTPGGASSPVVSFPLVQGMGFVTGDYHGGTPTVSSGIGINSITYGGALAGNAVYKYRMALANGFTWLIYVVPETTNYNVNSFTLLSANTVQGPSGFNGYIQVAKIPGGNSDAESIYDSAAGAYPFSTSVSGAVEGSGGSYSLTFNKTGMQTQQLLMFALPHHVESFAQSTANGVTSLQLMTTTKGFGTAVRADSWTLVEDDLPIDMSFAPWRAGQGSIASVSSAATALIKQVGAAELNQNITLQTDLDSMYYSGKGFAKFAALIYTLHDIGGDKTLALTGLLELENALATFVDNQQPYPLVFDSKWGGVVSSATFATGDSGLDFGNTYYNDHHFHYGYFVYAAAVIAYLDPTWLTKGTNKAWIDTLVRDFANPVTNDPDFPFSRNFDWFHGHSWAAGLFPSADGKNQESSSEDTMASYAIKMWGKITDDTAMEARGNLMLAIQIRSLRNYYLYTEDNVVEPAQFIGNKAAGILFENKIDHTTYFGTNIEYIEGIHMIPLMPFSTLTRNATFVQQEWDTYFSNGRVNSITGGWRGLLEANYAIIDPQASYAYFSNSTGLFESSALDGGASRTWYLAYSAGLGGSPAGTKVKRDEALMIEQEEVEAPVMLRRRASGRRRYSTR